MNQLEYFLTVAKMQHVTRAAESLSITQPALSHSLAKLEEELGVQLFERSGRNVQLNRFGHLFAARVTGALEEIQRGKEEIAELTEPESGLVVLAFGNILGTQYIPELIQKFQTRYPKVRFELYQGTCAYTKQLLESGACDLNITSPPSGSEGVAWRTLFHSDLYAVVPASHRLAAKTSISLDEMCDDPFIAINRQCGLRYTIDDLSQKNHFKPLEKYTAEDLPTVAGFVAAGLGVSLLPKSMGLMLKGIEWVKLSNHESVIEVGMEWKEKHYLSPSVRLFRNFALEESRTRSFI